EPYLQQCLRRIEEILQWGSSDHWQNTDFEVLQERIFEKTSVSLSSSTLKRIWGKVKYDSSPNLATLNALAIFIGFADWRSFVSSHSIDIKAKMDSPEKSIHNPQFLYTKIGAGLLLFAIILLSVFWIRKRPRQLYFKNLEFSSTPVSNTIPNTVVFKYDASYSNADSVFIQQDWDKSKRSLVDKNLHEFTTTYYEPGYFKAKLILNDSVVKMHDILVQSNGWLALVRKKPVPVYIAAGEIKKNDIVGVDESALKAYGISLQEEHDPLVFYNVSDSYHISGNDFQMKVELRNTFNKNEGVCQFTQVVIMATDGMILIPLGIKGCSGELNLFLGTESIHGRTHDLSGFGVDFTQWVAVDCRVQNRNIKISVNKKLVYSGLLKKDLGNIVGSSIGFQGTGEFKGFELRNFEPGIAEKKYTK
ncbi:MAG TPA: hypothetical protein VFV08_16840, partial [Puia sp.]|nr:hypothetical protein [Puia sp.]